MSNLNCSYLIWRRQRMSHIPHRLGVAEPGCDPIVRLACRRIDANCRQLSVDVDQGGHMLAPFALSLFDRYRCEVRNRSCRKKAHTIQKKTICDLVVTYILINNTEFVQGLTPLVAYRSLRVDVQQIKCKRVRCLPPSCLGPTPHPDGSLECTPPPQR